MHIYRKKFRLCRAQRSTNVGKPSLKMTIAYEPEKEETQQFSTDTVINQKVKQASSGLQGTIQRLFLRLPTEEDKELLADFILDSLQKQSVKTRTRRVYITALV